MNELVLVLGLLGVTFALIALFFKLSQDKDNTHFLLQLIFLGFIIGLFVLISKTTMDYKDNCDWLVNSTNYNATTNTTYYNHSYSCNINNNDTSTSFYKLTIWIMRITMIYILLYFAIELFKYFAKKKRGEE